MESYAWPGNVRELLNIVQRISILCDSDYIELWHLPLEIRQASAQPIPVPLPHSWEDFKRIKQQARDAAGQDLERRFVTEALRRAEGNVSRAAKDIGMQRTNLHAMMRKYGLHSDTA
jgi:DNA-binding NtrC family response regulator